MSGCFTTLFDKVLTSFRADEEDKEEAERGKEAEKQAIDFFTRWFASPVAS